MILINMLQRGESFTEIIITLLAIAIAATFSIIMHECAHGVVAGWCGDKTAKYAGRITLNPVKHLDPIGLIMLLFVGFGWAKPVPVDSTNFKNRRKGMIFTSLAGVATNFLIAGFFLLLLFLLNPPLVAGILGDSAPVAVLARFFLYLIEYFIMFNMMLMLFNLLPIYPLDGFRVLNEFLPSGNRFSVFMYRYGVWVLLGLMIFSSACDLIGWHFLDIFQMFSDLVNSLIRAVTVASW